MDQDIFLNGTQLMEKFPARCSKASNLKQEDERPVQVY